VNIPEIYNYLVRARRDLWFALESVSTEIINHELLHGDRFHSIKELVFHIAVVEDSWIHEDIQHIEPVRNTIAGLKEITCETDAEIFSLSALLDYWRAVEQSTLTYLTQLDDNELKRSIPVAPSQGEILTVDGLIWHIMIHEMRHTAQIAMLLRLQGVKPPSLDLLFYLPTA
jgi:uncharacterized damage-inducible protein DinB